MKAERQGAAAECFHPLSAGLLHQGEVTPSGCSDTPEPGHHNCTLHAFLTCHRNCWNVLLTGRHITYFSSYNMSHMTWTREMLQLFLFIQPICFLLIILRVRAQACRRFSTIHTVPLKTHYSLCCHVILPRPFCHMETSYRKSQTLSWLHNSCSSDNIKMLCTLFERTFTQATSNKKSKMSSSPKVPPQHFLDWDFDWAIAESWFFSFLYILL